MKLPLDWFREYVKTEETPEQLADLFTSLGLETSVVSDKLLDLEITPNRGDCLSVFGLAREYVAARNKPITLKKYQYEFDEKPRIVKITADPKQCSRYVGAVFGNITLKESSPHIRQRLRSCLITPHNNIIDITNLVMIETGQPLHAFDLGKVRGRKFNIRRAKRGEELEIISGKRLELTPDNLVIADSQRVIDLAGVMGGTNSSITADTREILIQAGIFDPKIIRASSKVAQVTTEASYRYERFVDPEGADYAVRLAVKLVEQECHAQPREMFDVVFRKVASRRFNLSFETVRRILGTPLDTKLVRNYLMRLGFAILEESTKGMVVRVPSFRLADIQFEQDLVEEVARLHGYHRLSRKLIPRVQASVNRNYQTKQEMVQTLSEVGFQEIKSYSLVSQKETQAIGIGRSEVVTLANPLSPERAVLRPTLIIGVLTALQRNAWWPHSKVFEIGRVFATSGEMENICLASSPTFDKNLKQFINDLNVIAISPDHPLAKLLKLRQPVELVETSLEFFLKKVPLSVDKRHPKRSLPHIKYRPISSFPPVIRDIAIVVAKTTLPDDIVRAVKKVDQRILLVELFDEFSSPRFGKHKKSLAFHIVFDDPEKTMTDTQANELMGKLTQSLKDEFAAKIR